MSGLSINKSVYAILSTDESLKKLVGKNIYPIVAEENVTLPFVTFTRTASTPVEFKGGIAVDKVTFQVNVIANDYSTSVTIAERIRELLEKSNSFTRVWFMNCTENYINDEYVQNLQFQAYT